MASIQTMSVLNIVGLTDSSLIIVVMPIIDKMLKIFEPIGCDHCTKGYKGRVGIYEVMPISNKIGRIIMSGGNAIEIADQARLDGVNNLRESGLDKVRQGLTSLAEINRITQD